MRLPSMLCIVIAIKYIEAGVITSASEIWNNNKIDTFLKHHEANNVILEDLRSKKSIIPKKYIISKNIPLFKKIPKELKKSVNKLSNYPDTFYKELYGIKKLEEKVKIRLHNMMKTDKKLDLDEAFLPPNSEELNKAINVGSVEDAVELSLSQDDTTEDTLSNVEQEMMEDGSQKLMKDFIRSHTVIPTKSDCHSDSIEEEKDLDEFIFMLNSQGPWEDVLDEDIETTTQIFNAKPRFKRRVNMIEEENMGSTVPGFKFTGHDMRLSNDLYYKNINS